MVNNHHRRGFVYQLHNDKRLKHICRCTSDVRVLFSVEVSNSRGCEAFWAESEEKERTLIPLSVSSGLFLLFASSRLSWQLTLHPEHSTSGSETGRGIQCVCARARVGLHSMCRHHRATVNAVSGNPNMTSVVLKTVFKIEQFHPGRSRTSSQEWSGFCEDVLSVMEHGGWRKRQ